MMSSCTDDLAKYLLHDHIHCIFVTHIFLKHLNLLLMTKLSLLGQGVCSREHMIMNLENNVCPCNGLQHILEYELGKPR